PGGHHELTVGVSPARHRGHEHLDSHHGQPRPSLEKPNYTLLGTSPITLCRDRRRARHPTKRLTKPPYAHVRTLGRTYSPLPSSSSARSHASTTIHSPASH